LAIDSYLERFLAGEVVQSVFRRCSYGYSYDGSLRDHSRVHVAS
jgi:hypothetical protein